MPESLFNKVAGISQVLQFLNFRVSSFIEDFLLISFQHKKWNKKGEYPDRVQILFFSEYRSVWRQRFQKKFDRWWFY